MKKRTLGLVTAAFLTVGLLTGCEHGVRNEDIFFQLKSKKGCISVSKRDITNRVDDYQIRIVDEKEKERLSIITTDVNPKIKIADQGIVYKFNDERLEPNIREEKVVLSKDLDLGTLIVYKRDTISSTDEYKIVLKDKDGYSLTDEKPNLLTVITYINNLELKVTDKDGKFMYHIDPKD